MLSPIERPFPRRAPSFAASMIPPPPPVMIEKPAFESASDTATAFSKYGCPRAVRALPKIETAGQTLRSVSKPSTNSPMILKTVQVSLDR